MSAREKVIGMMAGDTTDELRRIAERVADEILNEHARELAEKIRNELGHQDCICAAANLIDPTRPISLSRT